MARTEAAVTRARVAELDRWHTIEIAPGVVTPGGWDLRPTAEHLPRPPSLGGMRCLDIGTMDGFWALSLSAVGRRKSSPATYSTQREPTASPPTGYAARSTGAAPSVTSRSRGAARVADRVARLEHLRTR